MRFIYSVECIFISMRPRQWTKNILIFIALFFSQNLFDSEMLLLTFMAFIIFCALSGSVYLLNDIMDRERDKIHPKKSIRPIASGKLNLRIAWFTMSVVAILAIACAFWINIPFATSALGYLLIQILYSIFFKHVVIIDVFSLAAGYFLRILAGAEAIAVPVSSWLLACGFFLSLFLALCKRRHELVLLAENKANHRWVLVEYNILLLDQMISVATTSSLVAYAVYTMSSETIEKFNTTGLVYTVPFVMYGLYRYLYLVYRREEGGNPEVTLLNDIPLLIDIAIYSVLMFLLLY